MKYKTKNNLLIIAIAALSVLSVVVIVLITGFLKSDKGSSSSIPTEVSVSEIESVPEDSQSSEPPVESLTSESSGESLSESSRADSIGEKIVASAGALIGVPFADNGETPDGFDNSGFIYYVLRENGYITCPRTTDAQSKMGTKIGRDALKPGDLVFFGQDGDISEVSIGGIYIGNGKMIACLMPGSEVREVNISSDYYIKNFYGGISLS